MFDRCFITSDHAPTPGLEEFTFAPTQVEWRWRDARGTTAPACVDIHTGSFGKGAASIDLRGPKRGAEFEEAVDIYLRVPGWIGSSDDREHRGWLEAHAFHMKLDHRAIPGYWTQEQILEVIRFPDQLSPRLAAACIEGLLVPDVSVEVVALRSRRVLLAYRFRNCHVAAVHGGYASGLEGSRDLFTESIDISFTDVDFQYFAADAGARGVHFAGGGATLAVLTQPSSSCGWIATDRT